MRGFPRNACATRQKFQVYLISGEWKDSGGNLHPFGTLNNSYLQDPIDPAYQQRLPGMDTVFWLDSPGSRYYNDYPTDMEKIDSLTQIENFTSTVCSPYQLCPNIDWHLKLVVDPGGRLDLQQTQASLGHSAN